ncbi:hypothetical protein TIFTF001_030584 [Ficus carica]|uniref:Uncharacterized protein n=1 Tax=Ficus carica TaxID=3494 RepID=A0AA88DTI1_FICCA|nr:hypothetical protein TIFTF001_030584 [Ficus carica]
MTFSSIGWQTGRVDRACDRPVYLMDYFTSAVPLQYLVTLREEFEILNDVELMVPGPNDLLSRPPPGYITLSAEFFRAGLRLQFHPYLRRALQRLNVTPMQLNANAYRILISCFILWTKNYTSKLSSRAFQNLYRMKTVPASSGSNYFQGYQGTFITSCPDSDKTTSICGSSWRVGGCMATYHMVRSLPGKGFRLCFGGIKCGPGDRTRTRGIWRGLKCSAKRRTPNGTIYDYCLPTVWPGEVIVASRMPDPVVHYQAWIVVTTDVPTTSDWSKVPRGVPVATTLSLQSGSSSLEAWGPRIADEDMDLLLGAYFHLQNQLCPSGDDAGVNVQATRIGLLGSNKSSPKPMMVVKVERELRPLSQPARPLPTLLKPEQVARERINQSPLCLPPGADGKTLGLAIPPPQPPEPSRLGGAFSGNAAARGYSNRKEEKVASLDAEVKKARHAEKVAIEKAKEVEKRASQAENARKKAEEAQKKVKDDLSAARSEHSWYLQEVLPAAVDLARQQAEEYQNSTEFDARLLTEYKERLRDKMTAAKEDGAIEGGSEEGEVTGGASVAEVVAEDVVIIDESEAHDDPFATEQAVSANAQVSRPSLPVACLIRLMIGPAGAPPVVRLLRGLNNPRPTQVGVQSRTLLHGPETSGVRVCISRLVIGPARAPPMIGLGFPYNNPRPTLVGVQSGTLLRGQGTSGVQGLLEQTSLL